MLQGDLFAQGLPGLNAEAGVQRRSLDEHSWIDSSSRWLNGGDELLQHLATELRWTRAERPMYGRMVDEPRLGSQLRTGSAQTPVVIRDIAAALGGRYERSFTSVWVNYYRDGCDSVAWHSDRIGIDVPDAIVAIVSLGGPRKFLLRPKGAAPACSMCCALVTCW